MTGIDLAVLALVSFSALIGALRGLIRESFSLAAWVGGLLLAWTQHRAFAAALGTWIVSPALALALAFVLLLLLVLLPGTVLGAILGRLTERVGLALPDRLLGSMFGALRGLLIAALMVFLVALTPLAEAAWWQDSALISGLEGLAERLLERLPASLGAHFR
ncbi:CvpA family protein [Marichromatium bheemlicum]|uniref:CvpA family protein n=1 Tax=Marichromatium bheemlicum TaxID=365339 RepID=A0ABX1IAM9_9GAMM|nr:CvpA family protein [Marichromatium bheemlicum]NKN33240.1 CvpA family protein [Marichromatium bheemlicum]